MNESAVDMIAASAAASTRPARKSGVWCIRNIGAASSGRASGDSAPPPDVGQDADVGTLDVGTLDVGTLDVGPPDVGRDASMDAPIEPVNPWYGVHAAVTRQSREGQPRSGWRPEQRLSLLQALHGFTRGAAAAAGLAPLGLLRPGSPADLTAVAEDPTALAPAKLASLETVGRWIGV